MTTLYTNIVMFDEKLIDIMMCIAALTQVLVYLT